MTTPIVGLETIPRHLPQRLTIAFWFGYWATDTAPGEGFADLERAFQDLVARGFNTVRIDGLWSWCFRPDGSRRPPLEIGRVADPGYCDYGAGTAARGGQHVDALQRLLELFALARKYDVYVALTTWEYHPGHTLGFIADPAVRQEILDIPVPERFSYTATQIDRLLQVLRQEGFADRIAYVELHNEIEISLALGLPGGPTAVQRATEQQLAWLRARHPDLLFTGDHTLPCPEHGFDYNVTESFLAGLPANAQLLDHHLYAWACGVQVALFRAAGTGIGQQDLDAAIPRLSRENELYRWLLRPDAIPWDEYKRHFTCDWFEAWWAPLYLYQNMDIDRWDYWMFTHYPEYEARMQGFWRNAIALVSQHARERGVPLVCDEGYICWPPTHSQFEPSAVGRANLDFIVDHMLQAGYWGYMVSTYAFPGQPLWEQQADWLARTHARILSAT
jgi:hypothetical protein